MDIAMNPQAARVYEILKSSNSWEQCWSEGVTPWDMGGVTPILADLVHNQQLPEGRAFVPGCGTGYDVLALASPQRHAVGLDISETAIERAKHEEPSLRSNWGAKIAELLESHGELITLIFPVSNHEGGPPYAVSLEEYEKVLHPQGLNAISYEANALSPGERKGREFLARWRKGSTKV